VRDDIAIVELDQPVLGVPAAALAGAPTAVARIVGTGLSAAPGSGAPGGGVSDGRLRAADLRLISDAACERAYKRRRGNGGERFDAARMLCATDVDGRAPLSSGCNGDSGGPLIATTATPPLLLGVVSFGGARCGADRLPNVFTEVGRYGAFLTDPDPAWAPTTHSPSRVEGRARVGGRLRCSVAAFDAPPTRIEYTWRRQGGRVTSVVSRRSTYTVRRPDRGRELTCTVQASNAGGRATAPFQSTTSKVRVLR
jgi:hypothetical protein